LGGETKILTFHKKYERLEGVATPSVQAGNTSAVEGQIYLNDPALRLHLLLPEDQAFDMAVNILPICQADIYRWWKHMSWNMGYFISRDKAFTGLLRTGTLLKRGM
jgi:glyoxylate utilization-related uncharacterized protein